MAPRTIAEITRANLGEVVDRPCISLQNFKHIASYNWLNHKNPTIAVPGHPPRWSPPATASKLRPDRGKIFIDQNAERSPTSPLDPLFRSLFMLHPDFDINGVDLITDRNNIRKLLRFVQGARKRESFSIKIEVVGRTALFTRVSEKTSDVIRGFYGYGHSFEAAHTKKLHNSTGHHRIVEYTFGGLHCIIRFETDGYLPSNDEETSAPNKTDAMPKTVTPVENTIADLLNSLSVSEAGPLQKQEQAASLTTPSAITVKAQGHTIGGNSTLEMKTRVAHKRLNMADVTPQLWFSQTPYLVVGYHRNGLFDHVEVNDMTGPLREWEAQNQVHLHRLSELLKMIIAAVRGCEEKAAVVEYGGDGRLRIVTGQNGQALPSDLYAKWDRPAVTDAEKETTATGDGGNLKPAGEDSACKDQGKERVNT